MNTETKNALAAVLAPPPAAPRYDPHFVRNRDVMLRFLEGQSITDIAIDIGLDTKQVKAILRRQPVKQEIARLAGLANDRYVQERVDALTIEALDVVRDTMRGRNFNELRFKAAKELLDKSPILKAQEKSGLEQIGAGLGEAIISRLARLEGEQRSHAAARDVSEASEVKESETND